MKKLNALLICLLLVLTGISAGCRRPNPNPKESVPKPGNTERIKVKGASLSLKDFKGHVRWELTIEEVQESDNGMGLMRVTGSYYPPKGGRAMNISADEGWINPKYNRLELRRGVVLKRQRLSIEGEQLIWSAASGAIQLTGGVVVQSDAMRGQGENMTTDADFDNVRFEGSSTWSMAKTPSGSQRGKRR